MRATTLLLAALVVLAGCDSNDVPVRLGDAIDPTDDSRCLEGVTTVEDLVETQSQAASPTRTVVVDYVGRLADGEVFDETTTSPVAFSLTRVVPGFREGIGGRTATDDVPAISPMRIGERRRITIPPNKGYGFLGQYNSSGTEHVIPRCSTLEFDVTLRDLQ